MPKSINYEFDVDWLPDSIVKLIVKCNYSHKNLK